MPGGFMNQKTLWNLFRVLDTLSHKARDYNRWRHLSGDFDKRYGAEAPIGTSVNELKGIPYPRVYEFVPELLKAVKDELEQSSFIDGEGI
jgi:hypothetical protein